MTKEQPQRLISDMRGVRYGEVLAVFAQGTTLQAEVYGTQMLDGLGTKVATVDPVLHDFNGITKRRTATDSRM